MKKILIGLIIAVAPMVFAQTEPAPESEAGAEETVIPEHGFSLTPFIGYGWGGEVEIDDSQLTDGFKSVKFTPNDSLGLRFGMRFQRWPTVQLEASIEQKKTQLEDKARLFAQEPAGPFPKDALDTLDMTITHGLLSLIWDLRTTAPQDRIDGALQPFVLAGAGLTHFGATVPLESQVAPSVVIGGGTRLWLSRNTAVRFELIGTVIKTQALSHTVPITNRDCEGLCERTYRYPSGMAMMQMNIGFTWGYDSVPYLDKLFGRDKKSED